MAYTTVCKSVLKPTKYISGEDRTRTTLENAGKTGVPQESGAESGAVESDSGASDSDLMAVVGAWPTLSETIKRQVVALVGGRVVCW
jgi:hypothetical protein